MYPQQEKQEKRESHEAQGEKPPLKGEIPFKGPHEEWRVQVLELLKQVLKNKKYEDAFSFVMEDVNRQIKNADLEPYRNKIKYITIENDRISIKDGKKKEITGATVVGGLNRMFEAVHMREHQLFKLRGRSERTEFAKEITGGDLMLRLLSGEGLPSIERKKRAPTKEELDMHRRVEAIIAAKRDERKQFLISAVELPESHYGALRADTIPLLQNASAKELAEKWRFMDHRLEVEELFMKDPDPDSGYERNPFKEMRWMGPEPLRQLIQDNSKDTLTFNEVANRIYNERYDEFKESLKENDKVPDEVLKLLDKKRSKILIWTSLAEKLAGKDDDLLTTFKRIEKMVRDLESADDPDKLPPDLKKLHPHVDKIRAVMQALGDYIGYASKLVGLVDKLSYNKNKEAALRERTMLEPEKDKKGKELDTAENHVKAALTALFREGVEPPREYTSEIYHLFSAEKYERPIDFQDLNGNTATIRGEWFTAYQDPIAAYKAAFEVAQTQHRRADGTYIETVNETPALKYLNDALQLGIAIYRSMPHRYSLKQILDDLEASGVDIQFSGNHKKNMRNLYSALEIKNLKDLLKKDSEKAKLINYWRAMFIRIGSVMNQKRQAHEAERLAIERAATIAFNDLQAKEILGQLAETGLTAEQRAKLREVLVGGGLVVVPKYGGGFSLRYEFENGAAVDIGGAFPGWNTAAVGAAVGSQFEIKKDVTVTVSAGPGYSFKNEGGGWGLIAGGKIEKKFANLTGYVEGGAGLLWNKMPIAFAGTGINWSRQKERYEEALTKAQVKTGIDEAEKSGNPYAEVKANPDKYPALADILYNVEDIGIDLNEESQRDLFYAAYNLLKQSIQEKAIDDTTPYWWRRLQGIGIGVAFVNGIVPLPYIKVEGTMWNRTLVYRMATDLPYTQRITDEQATEAILSQLKGAGKEVKLEEKKLQTSGELILDREGKLALKRSAGTQIDFSQFETKYQEFVDSLANARIFVTPGPNGLLELNPREAHGNVYAYVDPDLKDKVILTTQANKLYISVKNDERIYVKREDISYPFKHANAIEETVILITANPNATRELIEGASASYFDRTPEHEWIRRPRGDKKEPQKNLKTFSEFSAWWGSGRPDRLKFPDAKENQDTYDELVDTVTLARQHAESDMRIRPEVLEKIKKLAADPAFLEEYSRLSTEGYDIIRKSGEKITATWAVNFPELFRKLREKTGVTDINEYEFEAGMTILMLASFQNLWRSGKIEEAKKGYERNLDFHRRLFTSIFNKYYNGNAEKTKTAVDWLIGQFDKPDELLKSVPGEAVPKSTLFATAVGMRGITGLRHHMTYRETTPEFGIVMKRGLDVKTKDISGEVARFWLKKLSPYIRGLHNETAIDQNRMYDNLHSPLALKLVSALGVVLNADERRQLTAAYRKKQGETIIDAANRAAIVKFLSWCDKVRTAQLKGEKRVSIDKGFAIEITTEELSMAVYKECGNFTGLMREKSELFYKRPQPKTKGPTYTAAIAEGRIDVDALYGRKDMQSALYAAVPVVL